MLSKFETAQKNLLRVEKFRDARLKHPEQNQKR